MKLKNKNKKKMEVEKLLEVKGRISTVIEENIGNEKWRKKKKREKEELRKEKGFFFYHLTPLFNLSIYVNKSTINN